MMISALTFLEYFIIQEGKMFNSILEILEEKAKQGVDVRLIYDDVGCIVTLPHNYKNTLEAKGIKCRVFNPIKPFFTRRLNNRDHRKIVVIDGDVGFTGGINLADEYINEYEKIPVSRLAICQMPIRYFILDQMQRAYLILLRAASSATMVTSL